MLGKLSFFNVPFFSAAFLSCALIHAETFYGPTEISDKTFDELIINGPADLKAIKAKSLTVHGPLTYDDLEVSGKTVVKGPTKGQKGKFNTLSVRGPFKSEKITIASLSVWGPAQITDFKVEGATDIHGPLSAQRGVFQDFIAGSGNGGKSVELNDVAAQNIVINEGKEEETLVLSGNTVISGNVIFKSGRGRIEKKIGNIVIQGKIEGALEGVKAGAR